ncbi:MAG TPA: hypothetical protein VF070_31440 [Streptosporangiaceae bacterium]
MTRTGYRAAIRSKSSSACTIVASRRQAITAIRQSILARIMIPLSRSTS